MKLSVSTLGCPDWDIQEIVSRLTDYGFKGVDFRVYKRSVKIWDFDEFGRNAEKTAEILRNSGLEVSCFSSSIKAVCPDLKKQEEQICEFRRYVDLCKIFNCSQIRIFGGKIGEMSRFEALKIASQFLKKLAKIAEDNEITIVIETHDDFIRSEDLLELVNCADSENVRALWDVHHPYRFFGETPEETWKMLGAYIKNTHWKDSQKRSGGFELCLCGEGDVPYAEILKVLKDAGYDGWLTFEWEKLWHLEIPDAERAFPNFISRMRALGVS